MHALSPPFNEPVPLNALIILFIGGHDALAMLTSEILESVATCVENGGILILMDSVARQHGIPVPRQHHLSSSRGNSSSVMSLLSQLPLRVDVQGVDRMTPRQALAATLAPAVRTILYSKKMHPETLCCTSCQQLVGSFHGQVTKTSERVCVLCEFHDAGLSGCQPLAASARFGKGSILHIVLTLGNTVGTTKLMPCIFFHIRSSCKACVIIAFQVSRNHPPAYIPYVHSNSLLAIRMGV